MSEKHTREQMINHALAASHVRDFRIERAVRAEGEGGERVVELAFASDTPVTHFSWSRYEFIDIKLSMRPGAVRTARLEAGAALLADHDHRDQIGVVESFDISEKDGRARATVRFSESQRGEDIYRDVTAGIRRNVSVGFMIHKLVLIEERKDENDLYEAQDWEPYEISIVAVPADIAAGVGRKLESGEIATEINRETEILMSKEKEEAPATAVTTAATGDGPESPELRVAREIREWGETLEAADHALDYLRTEDEPTLAGFRKYLRSNEPPPVPGPRTPVEVLAARSGAPTVELARSVYRGGPLKAFKGEGAHERAHKVGMFLAASIFNAGWAQKWCTERGISYTRTQTGTDDTKGGVLVIPEFEQSIIDLRIQYGVFRPNAEVIPMSSDQKLRNRRTGGLTAYPVGAGQAGTKSTAAWDQVELIARKWMVLSKYEDEVSEDAVINMADTLVDDAAYACTFAEDNAGFNGDGSSAHHGIVGVIPKLFGLSGTIANIAGLAVAAGNEWSEIVDGDLHKVIGRLPQFARRSGAVKWYCSHTFKSEVLDKLAFAKGGVTYKETATGPVPMFMGYPVELVEVMPSVQANSQICLLFGNLSQAAMFGDRRGITVRMTDSNDKDFESDVYTVKVTERFDINVHSVGNESATAALRKPGPIVGLITAAS